MDVDGTLTDGKIYMSAQGELFKVFDIKDGAGINEILPRLGIVPVIITGRESKILENRCNELGIKELHQNTCDKSGRLSTILSNWSQKDHVQYEMSDVAYIGDDIIDLQCMTQIKSQSGIVACPADAVSCVKKVADYICEQPGGNGAVREFIEWLAARKEEMK